MQGAEQRNKRSHHTCDLCDKVIIGDLEWTGEADDTHQTVKQLESVVVCSRQNAEYTPAIISSCYYLSGGRTDHLRFQEQVKEINML